jgi:hypothetical protein
MSNGSVITEKMRSMIGSELARAVHEVDKTMLRRLAEAIEDTNPRWLTEAAPGFVMAAAVSGTGDPPKELFPLKRMVAGGGEWEFYLPIKVGDVITCTTKLADLYEREGKAGKLLFIVTETTVVNQQGQLAAKARTTLINY